MLFGGIGVRDQWNPLQAMFCIILGIQGILHSYQSGVFMARYFGMLFQSSDHVLVAKEHCLGPAQLNSNAGLAGETRSLRSDNVSQGDGECEHIAQGTKVKTRDGNADGNQLQLCDARHVEQTPHSAEVLAGPHTVTEATAQVTQVDAISNGTADGMPSCKPPCKLTVSLQGAKENEQGEETGPYPFPATFAGVIVFVVSTTLALIGLAAFGYSAGHDEWPGVLLAGALAPLGALVRWQMAQWNSLPQRTY